MAGLLREARLSAFRLRSNLRAIADSGASVVDLRADAYGHGFRRVLDESRSFGFTKFQVSPGQTLPPGAMTAPDGVPVYEGVLTLVGEVVAVKALPAGSRISYGYTYRTVADSTVALVGLGYADGLPRLGSSRATASTGGRSGTVAGRIAMDQFVLDLGDGEATVGDEVVVWDADRAQEWSALARRSTLDLFAGLGHRVHRRWLDEGQAST
ncbi:MAG: alanine racemase [Microbacteriaceae bacterium]|nr:alanine racemase [Microbacteriaceae bacterium]